MTNQQELQLNEMYAIPCQVPASVILVVDDLPNNLKLIQRILQKAEHQLILANGGQEALDCLQSIHPDLILLDLMMPQIDGLEVCRQIKQMPHTSDIPIIFLTANHEFDNLIQAFERGAVDYLVKPFRSAELLARINTHLRLTHLQKQLQHRIIQETIIRRVIEQIHSSLDLQTLLENAVDDIQSFLEAKRVLVCQCVSATDRVIVTTSNRLIPLPDCSLLPPMSDERYHLSIEHPNDVSDADLQWLEHLNIHTEFRFPLHSGKVLWGILLVQFADYTADAATSINFLQPVVDQLAIAIKQSELYHQLKTTHQELAQTVQKLEQANTELTKLANIDKLTQIANRRTFDVRINHEWMRLQRENQPLSLIFIDIDYFKNYNDCYGHLRGDSCLQAVAHALDNCMRRPADLVARYGGEEFVVLLPNTHADGAEYIAQRLQQAIAQLQIPHSAHLQNPNITISLGIATTVPSNELSLETFISQADKALYQAKKKGRNIYCIANQ